MRLRWEAMKKRLSAPPTGPWSSWLASRRAPQGVDRENGK